MFLDGERAIRWIWTRELVEGTFLEEGFSCFFSIGLSYEWLWVLKLMVSEEIILIYFVELEVPLSHIWSINYCWDVKGSVSTTGVGLLFRNLLICSGRGHSFMKWSPPHNKKRYLAFPFPLLSFSVVVTLGFSSWFLGFLLLYLPFFLLIGFFILWIAFTSVATIGAEGVAIKGLCCLEGLDVDEGYIELTTRSTGVFACGLEGSMLGGGAWRIRSYIVLDWE